MTREKEIQHKAGSISDGMIAHNISQSECKGYYEGYIDGANWEDNHPKSPWISVNDDLPCNHKELLLSTGYHTRSACKWLSIYFWYSAVFIGLFLHMDMNFIVE